MGGREEHTVLVITFFVRPRTRLYRHSNIGPLTHARSLGLGAKQLGFIDRATPTVILNKAHVDKFVRTHVD